MNLQDTNMNYLGIRYSDVHFTPFKKHFILEAYHNPEHIDTKRDIWAFFFIDTLPQKSLWPHGVPFESFQKALQS